MALVRLEGTSSDVPVLYPEKNNLWRAVSLDPSQYPTATARITTHGLHHDQGITNYQGVSTMWANPTQIADVGRLSSILHRKAVDWSGPIGIIAKSLVRHEKLVEEVGMNLAAAMGEEASSELLGKIRTKPETWQTVGEELRQAQLAAVSETDEYVRRLDVDIWLTADALRGQPFHLVKLGGLAIRDIPRETLGHENLLDSFEVYPLCADIQGRQGIMPYDNSRTIFFGVASGLRPDQR